MDIEQYINLFFKCKNIFTKYTINFNKYDVK